MTRSGPGSTRCGTSLTSSTTKTKTLPWSMTRTRFWSAAVGTLSATEPGRGRGRARVVPGSAQIDSEVTQAAQVQDSLPAVFAEAQQHARAGGTAQDHCRRVHVQPGLSDGRDDAAVVAPPARGSHIDREDFGQRAGERVAVEVVLTRAALAGTGSFCRGPARPSVHAVPPMPPYRSVLIRSGAWPESTSQPDTVSTK